MKRIGIITLFATLFCFMITSVAMAYSLLGVAPVSPNTVISFQFYDYEFWVDKNANHLVDYGDQIYGVYKINGVVVSGISYGLGTQFLGGNFTYTVTAPSTNTTITAGDNITLQDEMNLYYNPYAPIDFNATGWLGTNDISPYISAAGGSASSSVKLASFVPKSGAINATIIYSNSDTSWPNGKTIAIISGAKLTTTGPTLFGPILGAVFKDDWEMNSYLKYPSTLTPPLTTTPTYQTTLTSGNFTWGSSDPISVTFSHPVPEPATIMLLGAGLLGLGSWGRKKTKKDKES